MNLAQKTVLVIACIVISVMALMPPWNYVYNYPGDNYIRGSAGMPYHAERYAGYHPIWRANTPTDQAQLGRLFSVSVPASPSYFSIRIDKDKLLIQFVATLAVTIILALLLRSRSIPNA